jgi:hypothetical protein
MRNNASPNQAFTRTELIVVIATLALLATLLVRAQDDPQLKARRDRIVCVNQLKQVGLAFRMWANDHDDKFPMLMETKKGGSLEAAKDNQAFRHFQVLSNELGKVKLLACPSDTREAAADFNQLKNANLSYFAGVAVEISNPFMLLSGDRNLTNGVAPEQGILDLSGEKAPGWTETIHNEGGNIGLSDGSVQQTTTAMLRRTVEMAKKANPNGKPRVHLPEVGSGSE